jgi:hypothetical protein
MQVRSLAKKTVEDIIEIGRLLTDGKRTHPAWWLAAVAGAGVCMVRRHGGELHER